MPRRQKPSNFEDSLASTISSRELFSPGEKIVVAVSGGLDSMCLLEALNNLARTNRWQLHVAHFDHQLRDVSGADANFVSAQAEKLGLGCTRGKGDVRAHSIRKKLSTEMAARALRRDFLGKVAREQNARSIAVAHHADDQVELFFLRLLRGGGSEGLAGMHWKSPLDNEGNVELVRPFLANTRAELEAYARLKRVPFREDASNASLEFSRNRVRHQLLPILNGWGEGDYRQPILRAMELLRAESGFISDIARTWIADPGDFDPAPLAIQRRIIHEQLIDLSITPDFELVEKLRTNPGKKVSVRPSVEVVRSSEGLLRLVGPKAAPSPVGPSQFVKLDGQKGKATFGGVRIAYRFMEGDALPDSKICGVEYFDADSAGRHVKLRTWEPGDRFQPIGLDRAVKLQDLFTNSKVPAKERRERVVAETSGGEIFWVEGLRIGERCKVTSGTRKLLFWTWQRVK